MKVFNPTMQNNCQRRVTINRSNVISETGIVTFQNEKSTEIYDNGDVISTEIRNYLMINGETVHDASEVKGQCQIPECSILLTQRTMRFCHICGEVGCPKHIVFDGEFEIWLCLLCTNGLNRRRMIGHIFRLLTAPFVERIEE